MKNMSEIEMIPCARCQRAMPKLRKTKYGYNYCIKCSTEKPKVAKNIQYGSKDDTWNDIIIMDQDVAKSLLELENEIENKKTSVEILDFNSEEDENIKKYRVNDFKNSLYEDVNHNE